jgi:HEAT repeat protein
MAPFGPPNVEKLKAKGNVEGLIKALGYEKDSTIGAAAIEALSDIGSLVVEPLIATLSNSNENISWKIISALGKIGDPRAVEPLIHLGLGAEKEELRSITAEALGIIGD